MRSRTAASLLLLASACGASTPRERPAPRASAPPPPEPVVVAPAPSASATAGAVVGASPASPPSAEASCRGVPDAQMSLGAGGPERGMLATGYLIHEATRLTPEGVEQTEDYAEPHVLEGVPTNELDAAKRYCARVRRPRATKNTEVRRACATKPRGHAPEVWAVVTTQTHLPGGEDGPQTLTLEHYDRNGVRAKTGSSGWGWLAGLFDFDGNGSMELLTASSKSTDMAGGSAHTVKIWTVKGRQVTLYGDTNSWTINGVMDFDLDDWPDLVIDPYGITYGSPWGWSEGRPEWSILAHGTRDGRFALDDGVAKEYARALCCKRPTAVCTERANCSAAAVHCARLWGAEPNKLEQDIAQLCAKPSDDPQDPCQNDRTLQQMATAALPPGLRLGAR